MKRLHPMKWIVITLLVLVSILLAACAAPAESTSEQPETTDVTLMLDWVPNVNHTGIFVAQDQGYFTDAGLNVDIIQPGEVFPESAVASGTAEFGVSFQEYVTISRADEIPIVSIAAIIQENTSGFATRTAQDVDSPADWEGLTYGSFGSPFEEPTLQVLMECDGGDFSQLEIVNTGFSDPLALLDQEEIDLGWIFFGVQGFQAEAQDVELDYVMMNDWFDCIPNYYTPVIITNENMIETQPDVVSAFMAAVSQGYTFAIENPEEAASILVEQVPELDAEVTTESQGWMSEQYALGAPQWGHQERTVWQDYTDWMVEHAIIDAPIDVDAAFTTEFLP